MIHDETRVLIKTEKLGKTYRLGNELKEAVKEADIRITQGEFVVINGLSGIQKNTFFNLIGCLERPTSGKYYFDYEDIALAKADVLDDIRKLKLGYLFRNFNLVGRMTTEQNVELPVHDLNIPQGEKRDRVLKALKRFGVEGLSGEKAQELPYYEKQMVALARAVVNNPLMIIADEPAENLDSKEEQRLMEHLFELNGEGTAIMLITAKNGLKVLNGCRRISFAEGRVSEDKEAHKLSLVRREA